MPLYEIAVSLIVGALVGWGCFRWRSPQILNFSLMMTTFLFIVKLLGLHPIGLLVSGGGWLILLVVGMAYWTLVSTLFRARAL